VIDCTDCSGKGRVRDPGFYFAHECGTCAGSGDVVGCAKCQQPRTNCNCCGMCGRPDAECTCVVPASGDASDSGDRARAS